MYHFNLQRTGWTPREQLAIINSARRLGVTWEMSVNCLPDAIPVGSVAFCEAVFGPQPEVKQFCPPFLSGLWGRAIELVQGPRLLPRDSFCKSATEWKPDVAASIWKAGQVLPHGLWWLSDVVQFQNEWRYYVTDGDVVTTGWYAGNNEDMPAPTLNVDWPCDFGGAVDFGECDGRMMLVEAHAPFACGWYGTDHELFAIWQAIAWEHRGFWIAA